MSPWFSKKNRSIIREVTAIHISCLNMYVFGKSISVPFL